MKSIKHDNYRIARKFGNAFKFADDIIAVNDGNELGNQYNVIYIISARSLYDETSSYNFSLVNLHIKVDKYKNEFLEWIFFKSLYFRCATRNPEIF